MYCSKLTLHVKVLTWRGHRRHQKILSSSDPRAPPSTSLDLHKWLFFTYDKTSPSSRVGQQIHLNRRAACKDVTQQLNHRFSPGLRRTLPKGLQFQLLLSTTCKKSHASSGRSLFQNRKHCGSVLLCGCQVVWKNFLLQLFVHAANAMKHPWRRWMRRHLCHHYIVHWNSNAISVNQSL